MKKLVLVLTMLLAFACSSLAFAADGGDLNKEQKTAEKMMTSLDVDAAAGYAALSPTLSADLNKALGEKNFAAIQSQVKKQFGSLKETKFHSFERFDQGDRVTYIAAFSKENVVIMPLCLARMPNCKTSASLRTKLRKKLLLKRNNSL